jgi:hypothetical protein
LAEEVQAGGSDLLPLAFRLRLDGSFIDGPGQVSLLVRDIDGLSSSVKLALNFFHASPSVTVASMMNATAGDRLEPSAFVEDLDGLTDVECTAHATANGTRLGNFSLDLQIDANDLTNATLGFAFPTTQALSNQTVIFNFTCIDGWGQSSSNSTGVTLAPAPPCENCTLLEEGTNESKALSQQKALLLGIALALALLGLIVTMALRRGAPDAPPPLWALEEEQVEDNAEHQSSPAMREGSALPAGWSAEAYRDWLEGPMPEGWDSDQWSDFKEEQFGFFEHASGDLAEKD